MYFTFRNFNVLSVLYVCMLLCLSVCLSVFIVPFLLVYYFLLGMLPEIKLIWFWLFWLSPAAEVCKCPQNGELVYT